ncbi:MAG: glycosyltransferase [Kiritimatiellaeota bacterium]|nr:glycosyltransferase [Kiritimatiellota bacterium]
MSCRSSTGWPSCGKRWSTDGSRRIAEEYAQRDARVRVVTNTQGKGLVGVLNSGLDTATGTYIARMDADDISLPERLQRQVQFMEAHPQVGACGTWFRFLSNGVVIRHPESHADIKIKMLGHCALTHPTVMLRKSILEKYKLRYDVAFKEAAEDYYLWVQLAAVTELANVPEILLEYRTHEAQFSQQFSQVQIARSRKVRLLQAQALGLKLAKEEEDLYLALVMASPPDRTHLPAARKIVERVLTAASSNGTYAMPQLKAFFEDVLAHMPPPPPRRWRRWATRLLQVLRE